MKQILFLTLYLITTPFFAMHNEQILHLSQAKANFNKLDPILKPYYAAMINTPQYAALQQTRALYNKQHKATMKTKDIRKYHQSYYQACKLETAAYRATYEYKAYINRKRKLDDMNKQNKNLDPLLDLDLCIDLDVTSDSISISSISISDLDF